MSTKGNQSLFATPLQVDNLEECSFYHVMDIPGVGEVGDHWDLRKTIDSYFGQFDFNSKTVLDVGAASGFLTFEMERRGASVTSFDIIDGSMWDIVPHNKKYFDRDRLAKNLQWHIDRIKKGYWYAHKAFASKACVYYGDIYDFSKALGEFDVVMFGMVLPHLRDPFKALHSASELSKEWIVITQQGSSDKNPTMHLMPRKGDTSDSISWWLMSDSCVQQMLEVIGFEISSISKSKHFCKVRNHFEECTTYIARRVD
ncbi:class I SAM-dependent methyltransferase [Trichocoleus sp. DQ-A3]|uniref:class I SAM-dependent methyltransferase n=1 Tax=Cyanophyceae TaxID=3028117 RepID=UPI001687B7E6|nr:MULTISPECIES: methyltransferase domain-containing protein [unclassified Coleofasciculus]MBD1896738.1 methyltransferase domain-containing protein [Coleofasciculus sp. FACHB-129]MBD1898784.1 methyltransferase domain-containing protein [Coleofasciculus sp. FACHB-125]